MKKIYIALIIAALAALIVAPCFASEPVKKNKNLKAGLCFSGGMVIAGSIIKIVQTQKPTPVVYDYEFEKRKNQNDRLANVLFFGAGVTLFTVSFTF